MNGRDKTPDKPFAVVLGIAQDGGVPHAGCERSCCERAWKDPAKRFLPSCLGIVHPASCRCWLLDATPALPEQLWRLRNAVPSGSKPSLSGIFPTHAHLGHYLGLAFLGKEALCSRGVEVFALPRMAGFIGGSLPWKRLLSDGRIRLRNLIEGAAVELGEGLEIEAVTVPHRDEDSETAAFFVRGPRFSLLYLPDVDSWEAMDEAGGPVEELIARSDRAYLDATFFDLSEVGGAAGVPHPPAAKSMERFSALGKDIRSRISFIHLNHTNPLLSEGRERRAVEDAGIRVAAEGEVFDL